MKVNKREPRDTILYVRIRASIYKKMLATMKANGYKSNSEFIDCLLAKVLGLPKHGRKTK